MVKSVGSAKNFLLDFWAWLKQLGRDLRKAGKSLQKSWRKFKQNLLSSFAAWIDPKLQPYHEQPLSTATPKPPKAPADKAAPSENTASASASTTSSLQDLPAPQSIAEFLKLMKRTPRSVLSQRERHVIAAIMKFPNIRVADIMLPKTAITYVKANEVLGPLTLDRLYRSGFQHFPVIDSQRQIIGLVHTTALNSLEVKQTSRAHEILDPKVYYLRADYTLNQALAAFLRTNCYFFLVIDRYEQIVGMLTYQMIVDFLLGETPSDEFTRDADRLAVAKRQL